MYDLKTNAGKSVEHVAFSPDGQWVFADPGLWRLTPTGPEGGPTRLPIPGDPSHWYQVQLTDDSRRIVLSHTHDFKGTTVWDLARLDPAAPSLKILGKRTASKDGRWVVVTKADGPAQVWDLRDGSAMADGFVELSGPPVKTAVFFGDGSTLATCHTDGAIRVHRLKGLKDVSSRTLRDKGDVCNQLQFSMKGDWLLASAFSATDSQSSAAPLLLKLDGTTKVRLNDREVDFGKSGGSGTEYHFSPTDAWLVAGQTLSSVAYAWDLRDKQVGKSARALRAHENHISYFEIMGQGDVLVTSELLDTLGYGPYRQYPRLWRLSNPARYGATRIAHPDELVTWSRFSPDGDSLAVRGSKGTVILVKGGRPRAEHSIGRAGSNVHGR